MVFLLLSPLLEAEKMVVIKPVESLWLKPNPPVPAQLVGPWLGWRDVPDHDTQLLYGERVIATGEEDGDWIRVKTFDQPWFNKKEAAWDYCSGWIRKDAVTPVDEFPARNLVVVSQYARVYQEPNLSKSPRTLAVFSIGTLLNGKRHDGDWWHVDLLDGDRGFIAISDANSLDAIDLADKNVLSGRLGSVFYSFLGSPYCWGGRSAYARGALTSVDCSSLVNLMFLACGLRVPRNSGCQYQFATKKDPCDLEPGDFLFLKDSSTKPAFSHITHIMHYLDDDVDGNYLLGEATGADSLEDKDRRTRIVTDKERFGVSIKTLKDGARVGDYEFYGGTFLQGIDLQALREVLR